MVTADCQERGGRCGADQSELVLLATHALLGALLRQRDEIDWLGRVARVD